MERMALMGMVLFGVGLLFIPIAQTHTVAETPCEIPVMDNLTVQPDFSLEKFMGKWYRINTLIERRDPFTGEPHIGSETAFTFWIEQYNDTAKPWVNFTLQGREPGGAKCHVLGHATYLALTSVPGKLKMFRSGRGSARVKDFWILMTDYEDYALIYACHKTDSEGKCESIATYMYVLGRGTSLAPDNRRAVDTVIRSLCLNMTNYWTASFDQPCDGGTSHVISLLLLIALVMLPFAAK